MTADESKKTIDQQGNEILDPRKMTDQTLAVDLAGVEIDRQIATAHRYPRSIDTVIKRIRTYACYNDEAAESCIYSLPRANKPIIGASIGFASIVMQAWGNYRAGSQIMGIDLKQKVVKCQGVFLDLESNGQTIVPVDRRISDSKGRLYSEDMQNVAGQAGASIALRNAILRAVPRGLWFPVWLDAVGIVRGDVTTFEEKKAAAFKAMTQFGVKPEQIFMALGIKGEADMTFENIPAVRGMYATLRDGTMSVEEMFDPRRMTGKGFETVTNPLGEGEPANTTTTATPSQVAAQETTGKTDIPWEESEEVDPTTGMGEASAENAPAAAGNGAPVAQTEKPAAKAAPAENSPASPAKGKPAVTQEVTPAAATQKTPKADAPAQKTEGLRTPEEYLAYWEGFLASATSITAIGNQWSGDRTLRGQCRVVQDTFTDAMKMKTAREAELKAKMQ